MSSLAYQNPAARVQPGDELPFDSDVRWVGIDAIAERLIERLRSGHDAVRDLAEALAQGRLRGMARSNDTGGRKLLEPAEWAALRLTWGAISAKRRGARAESFVNVVYRKSGQRYRANFYIWLPDAETIWPSNHPAAVEHPAASVAVPAPPIANPPTSKKARNEAQAAANRIEKIKRRAEAAQWLAPKLTEESNLKDHKNECMKDFDLTGYEYDDYAWPAARILAGLKKS